MLALCALYYLLGPEIASTKARQALLAAALAPALAFGWVLYSTFARPAREAAWSALLVALVYLVGFGWIAVALYLLSWGSLQMKVPALGLPVQFLVLACAIAALRATRGEAAGTRIRAGVLTTLALCAAGPAAAALMGERAARAPAIAEANDATASAALGRCLADGCAPDRLPAPPGFAVELWPGPAAAGARPGSFSLCARPLDPPDTGRSIYLATESEPLQAFPVEPVRREADPCVAAWALLAGRLEGALKHCLHAAAHPLDGYPASFEALSAARPACLASLPRSRLDGAMLAVETPSGVRLLRYLPTIEGGRASGYRLYLDAPERDEQRVLDERGRAIGAAGPAPAAGRDAPVAAPLPGDVNAPERRFGASPDLDARRADCAAAAADCYELGRELERAVRQDGGNDARPETLDDPQLALVREANDVFRRACEAGRPRACAAYGDVLIDGRAVDPDVVAGGQYVARACERGYAPACRRQGELLENGRRALRPLRSSVAALPGGPAPAFTGWVTDDSVPGIPADPAGAARAYRRACELGDADACLMAARVLMSAGALAESLAIYAGRCDAGEAFGCSQAAALAGRLPPGSPGAGPAEYRRRACALGSREDCAP